MKTWKLVAVAVFLCAAATTAEAQKIGQPIVIDGNDWMKSSPREREVFLVGVANMIVAETAYARHYGSSVPPVSDGITRAVSELKLDDVESRITRWYQANPARMNTPVMAVVWQDLVKRQSAAQGGR